MKRMIGLLLLGILGLVALVITVATLMDPAAVDSFTVSDAVAVLPSYGEVRDFVGLALGWGMVAVISMVLVAVTVLSLFREVIVTAVVGSTKARVVNIGYDTLMGFFPSFLLSPVPESDFTATQPHLVFDPTTVLVDWSELNGEYRSSRVFHGEVEKFRSKYRFPANVLTNDLVRFLHEQGWVEQKEGGTVVFFCGEDIDRMAS